MGSQYDYQKPYGESTHQQNNSDRMPYYAAPRGFNTVAQHMNAGQAVEHIPHRIFVGGFGTNVTEANLREHFERFYTIRDVKVIRNHEGISKGYAFVTFDTEEEAKAVQGMSKEELTLNGKTLNLGPALRKMVHSRYNSDYMMTMPTGQYPMQSPAVQYSYSYPSQPHNGTSHYMMGYAPQGMMPVSHSPPTEESSQSHETSGAEEQLQQGQQTQSQQPPALSLQPGVVNSPPSLYSAYYAPPHTPMTPTTFQMMPFPSLYYPPQTPQMTVDGATLFPQMVASPMMYSCPQYFPPTPSMDTSYSNGYHQNTAPAAAGGGGGGVCSPTPVPLMSQQLHQPHHYPPLVSRHDNCNQQGGEEQREEMGKSEMGVMPKQAETSIQDIRVSYASIAAKIKIPDSPTVSSKEVDQVSSAMGSMKMNGAGGDYASTTRNGGGGGGATPRL